MIRFTLPSAFAVFSLLVALMPRAFSQPAPRTVEVASGYTRYHEQKSATLVELTSAELWIGATVPGALPSTVVQVVSASGLRHTLLPISAFDPTGSTSYALSAKYSSADELRTKFPPGGWELVSIGASGAISRLSGFEIRPPPASILPQLTNYAELDRWTGGKIRIAWLSYPAPGGNLLMRRDVSIQPADLRFLIDGEPQATSFEYDLGDRIAPGETYHITISSTQFEASAASPWLVSDRLRITLKRFSETPIIDRQPSELIVAAGGRVALSVGAIGPDLRYQWLKDGNPIAGATGSSLTIAVAQVTDAGNYSVRVTNDKGGVTSATARVTVVLNLAPPKITTQPASVAATAGASLQFQVVAEGETLTYQWQRDGVAIQGATSTSLSLAGVRLGEAGRYSVVVTNGAGSVTSEAAALTVEPITRISNLSMRAAVGGQAGILTIGLTLGGENATAAKPVLVRAIGPTLSVFGVSGALPDPSLALLSGSTVVARNDNWSGNALVASTSTEVGAFDLSDATSKDAALVFSSAPGSYTLQIDGTPGGVALAEIYDATNPGDFVISTARLVNVSALTQVGTGGDILIAGFSVTGSKPRTMLIRAIGPSLAGFGVGGVLADPRLELYRAGAAEPQSANDNWNAAANAADIAATAARVGAFALPSGSRDAVILVSLPPGSYTAQVSGVGGSTGKALVEVYEVP